MKMQSHKMYRTKIVWMAFCGLFTAVCPILAQTWTQTSATNTRWAQVAASADGSKLAAIDAKWLDVIWVSTNAGTTWTSNNVPGVPVSGRLESVAWSACGDKLTAVAFYASAIFTSTNYGATWISNSVPVEPWWRIASSADGKKLVAVGGGLDVPGPIYVSADAGQTWTQANAPITNWVSVASSANGSNLVAAVELLRNASPPLGYIYTSTNCGFDWTLMTGAPNLQWLSVASSADGTKFLGTGSGPSGDGLIYTSTNSGATWVSNAVPNEFWYCVASSADGRTLAAVAIFDHYGNPGYIYTSTNSGITWISNSVPRQNWAGIASSADGGILVASVYGPGGIYILQTLPQPELTIMPVGNNLALSWTIPSTEFSLQQNLDLTTTNWMTLTNPVTLDFNNLQKRVALPPSASTGFYRLVTP